MNVRYENHAGASFTLYGDDLGFIDPMQLHTWAWSYDLANRVTGYGGAADGFARWPRTFELELRMRGYTRAQFLARMNDLLAVADADNIAGQPGRIIVTGRDGSSQYLRCFLAVAGAQPEHPRMSNFATRGVTVLAVEPYWITEQPFNIYAGSNEGPGSTDGKKYNYKYGYRYGTGLGARTIINSHYAATPVRITVFGPASNPSVTIGGNVYAVTVTLIAGERLIIDPLAPVNKIYVINETGDITNVFDSRDKAHDIFAPVQPGENDIIYSGDYDLTLTLIQQRSELAWTE